MHGRQNLGDIEFIHAKCSKVVAFLGTWQIFFLSLNMTNKWTNKLIEFQKFTDFIG